MVGTDPPGAAARCRFDQSSSGACGAHDCQAEITRAACDHGQDRKNRTISPAGWVRKVNEVTTPKLPPPPPRQAQNRSELLARAAGPDLAVGRDDLQGLHVVAGQPVGAGHHPDAAAEREAGDADRRAGPAGHRAAVRRQAAVEVDQPGAGPDGRGAPADVHPGHPGHVDDQAAGRGPARVAVPAAAGGHRDAVLADEGQAGRHVVRVAAVGDAGRVQLVEARVEQPLGHGVARLARADQRPGQVMAEGRPVGGGGRSAWPGGRRSRAGRPPSPGRARRRLAAASRRAVLALRLQDESSPAPPAAAANRRNARRPWTMAIA